MNCYMYNVFVFFFFFKQKTAYEMRISDWSSDVCSSDLGGVEQGPVVLAAVEAVADADTVRRPRCRESNAAAQATASESVHAASPPIRRAECCADRAGARTGARTGRSLRQRVDRRQVAALLVEVHAVAEHVAVRHLDAHVVGADAIDRSEIGRASCRERVCQYV